jgi:hypothetical protein
MSLADLCAHCSKPTDPRREVWEDGWPVLRCEACAGRISFRREIELPSRNILAGITRVALFLCGVAWHQRYLDVHHGLLVGAREVCICAAVRLPDGRVFRGHRHSDCLLTARQAVNAGRDEREYDDVWRPHMGGDQGFVTSRNRYVDREEGLKLQLAAGIKSACPSGYRVRELFSEDLY